MQNIVENVIDLRRMYNMKCGRRVRPTRYAPAHL